MVSDDGRGWEGALGGMAGSALQATTRAAMVMWRRERKAEMWHKGEESPTAARQSGGGYGEVVALPLAAMETGTGAVAGEGTDWSREIRPQRWVPTSDAERLIAAPTEAGPSEPRQGATVVVASARVGGGNRCIVDRGGGAVSILRQRRSKAGAESGCQHRRWWR